MDPARLVRKENGHLALRRGRRSLVNHVYHVTTTTKAREAIFADSEAAQAASRCFVEPSLIGDAVLLAWVLMPDHAHWLLQLGTRDSLGTVVARLKSASARKTNAALGRKGTLWEMAYHDRAMRSDEGLVQVARYIVANPLRAGLVTDIRDYPYWNSVWL